MEPKFKMMSMAKYFFTASILIITAGIVMLILQGFKLGIDFSGGTIMDVDLHQNVTDADLEYGRSVAAKYIPGDIVPSISETTHLVLRYQDKYTVDKDNIAVRESIQKDLTEKYPKLTPSSMTHVGAVAGDELKRNALISITIACILMLIYVAIRFEFVYGVAAIAALVHDVAMMSAFMIFFQIEVNSSFVAALLTIIGYSMNDTIVVFDRIRENNKKMKNLTKAEIINVSFLQTLRRTINVSATCFITMICLYILGVPSIREFAFPLIVGIVTGTYSSILIAAPIWMWVHNAMDRRRMAKIAAKKQLKGGKKAVKAKAH
jgi:preprotein translocase subunit SecF